MIYIQGTTTQGCQQVVVLGHEPPTPTSGGKVVLEILSGIKEKSDKTQMVGRKAKEWYIWVPEV